jgi:hypothetical protein
VPAAVTTVAPAAQVSHPGKPSPRPHRAIRRPAARPTFFRPALAGQAADTYRPGQPVMPIGVLLTVVLTPCVITVAARLGKLLCGR